MLSSRAVRTVIAVLLALAATAPAAAAAQRYASPTGFGGDCSSVHPCSLVDAIGGSVQGDDVIVNPGDYPVTSMLLPTKGTTIHGVAGKPRPRLLVQAGVKGMDLEFGATLRYVELQADHNSALFAGGGATVDQVIARTHGDGAPALTIRDATMRDSIAVASGTHAIAVAAESGSGMAGTATIRNVTAVATGTGAIAIRAYASTKASQTANLANVIAYGGSTGLPLVAATDNSGAQATMNVTHSVYASSDVSGAFAEIVDGGGNHWQTPAFVNAAGGDYREAPGSYTINAGLDSGANGALDVDGGARVIGTTDIGADEFLAAPTAATGPAGAVTLRSATLSGTVNPRGAPTHYRFEYGPTSAYGRSTPTSAAGSGLRAVPARASLSGLTAGTTYHYRLVATNAGGTAATADRTFTTVSLPPFGGVRLASTRLASGGQRISLTLRCPAGTVGRCTGVARLSARHRRLGRAGFSIAAGERARVQVPVSRAGRRVLRHVRRLHARERNVARDGAGRTAATAAAVTIRVR